MILTTTREPTNSQQLFTIYLKKDADKLSQRNRTDFGKQEQTQVDEGNLGGHQDKEVALITDRVAARDCRMFT